MAGSVELFEELPTGAAAEAATFRAGLRRAAGRLGELIADRRVIVCCGAGGVGKTSVSAGLAVAAARSGRRVLVVTVDPSRRLAETLGVARNAPAPIPLSAERLAEAGVRPPGRLHVWMLDPQSVSDAVVVRMVSPENARRLLDNRIYREVTSMIAGMQEYTAVEALHGFVKDDSYDLVVLDTPPSRNALHFLDAPSRVGRFLDGRVFQIFTPNEGNAIRRAASKIFEKAMDVAFGHETRIELQTFFSLFSTILGALNRNAHEMRQFFSSAKVAFLVVTSPRHESLVEADFFAGKTQKEMGLNLEGYVLNRSLACSEAQRMPSELATGLELPSAARSGLAKLEVFARNEVELRAQHRAVLSDLEQRARGVVFAMALPFLPQGVQDIASLGALADALTGSNDSP